MSVRAKTLLLLSFTLTCEVAALLGVMWTTIVRHANEEDEAAARESAERGVRAIQGAIEALDKVVLDWASWDDTYAFMRDRNAKYVAVNINQAPLENLNLTFMLLADTAGRVVAAASRDSTGGGSADFPAGLQGHLKPGGLLVSHRGQDEEEARKGVIMLSGTPLLFASRPILTSEHQGPSRGTFVMGRILDSLEVSALGARSHLEMSLQPLAVVTGLPGGETWYADLRRGAWIGRIVPGDGTAMGYALIRDIYGNPATVVVVREPRRAALRAGHLTRHLMAPTLAAGILLCVAAALAMDRLVLARLARLTREVSRIGEGQDWSARVAVAGQDELAQLCRAINQTLDALGHSEEQYRLLVEHAALGVALHEIVLDADGRPVDYVFLGANPAFETHTGLRVSEVLGRRITEVLPEIEEAPFIDVYGQVVLTGEPVSFEQYVEPLGRTYSVSAYRIGESRFATVFMDITARKQMEEALRESEARLTGITESAQDAIIMMDPQGLVSFWNRAAEKILGYRKEEVLGRNLHELVVPERWRGAFEAAFPEFVRSGRGRAVGRVVELTARRKDGQEITVALSLSALWLKGQWHAVGVVRDVTDRRKAEQELLETNQQLEVAVERANRMALAAEAASVAKSEFLANMSHEIRTPMNGVIGMLSLALETELTPEQREFLELAASSAETLLALINDILDLSKIEAGRMELEFCVFDPGAVLESAMQIVSSAASAKGLELACQVAPDVPSALEGDPDRLRQILVNLAGNAVKFTSEGEVMGSVRVQRREPGRCWLEFAVTDTGIGIPQEAQARIFRPFEQADGSVTRQHGGTGLGLAICRRLVEMMGGDIEVSSQLGVGSTFRFRVPLRVPASEEERSPGTPRQNLEGMQVLVVDDNETNRRILAGYVKSWGALPTCAADGAEALRLLRERARTEPVRLVLLDAKMPGLSGLEVARQIRSSPELGDITVLIVSSLGAGVACEAREAGAAGCIVKPVKRAQLLDAVEMALAVRGQQTALPSPPASESQTAAGDPHTSRGGAPSGLRILLAEDNVVNQKVAVKTLRLAGHEVDVVDTGIRAVEAVASRRYDLVLMDLQMPQMDGLQATALIRQMPQGKGLPIIALTAHALQGDEERCLATGMDDYMSKPLRLPELHAMVAKWCGGGSRPPRAPVSMNNERADTAPPADLRGLADDVGGDLEFARQLLEEMLVSAQEHLPRLQEALEHDDGELAGRIAHTLAGGAASVRAQSIAQAAREAQECVRRNDDPGARSAVEQLSKAIDELADWLEQRSEAA